MDEIKPTRVPYLKMQKISFANFIRNIRKHSNRLFIHSAAGQASSDMKLIELLFLLPPWNNEDRHQSFQDRDRSCTFAVYCFTFFFDQYSKYIELDLFGKLQTGRAKDATLYLKPKVSLC